MKYLITGGCGFLGSNLSAHVLSISEELFVIDNFYREGARENYLWLQSQGSFAFYDTDTRNYGEIERIINEIKPDVIFHLAGQVAMTTSLESPEEDFSINVIGGFNILEAARRVSPYSKIIYSSTNKVYGDLDWVEHLETETRFTVNGYTRGFDESTPLSFQSPYGCSKGTIDQYMQDYYRMYDLQTVVFRHSTIFGGRQFATFHQGWVGWFIKQALRQKEEGDNAAHFTVSGNGKQVRDILFTSDLINCYFTAIERIDYTKGDVFNIGGGVQNSLSILELFSFLENHLSIELKYENIGWRKSDQKVFIADISKAKNVFGWAPETAKETGLLEMVKWQQSVR